MKNKMFFLIVLSIVLAIFCGVKWPEEMLAISWIGKLFINLLKIIALPLIFSALVTAITSIGHMERLGTIGLCTLGYVFLSVSVAVVIGLLLLNLFHPGNGIPPELITANASPLEMQTEEFSSWLLALFPQSIVDAAARYEIMPIVFFSIVFSMACLSIGDASQPVVSFFAALRNVLVKMIIWLMTLTPIGLFSLLGTAVAEASIQHLLWRSLTEMLKFIIIFLAGLLMQFLWQWIVVAVIARKNPWRFLSAAGGAMITAFATSSSMVTLPVTLMVAREQGIRDEVARFVLPLATTVNLAGTAMYEAVSALFFCQILGLDLSIAQQIGVFITAILAGMGATGIPEGGLVTMVMVLRSVSVPASAIGLLLPFDRILDRFRTVTNVWGDLVCAATVERMQQVLFTKKRQKKVRR